eukprot:TRINITY_DN11942_c0_g1_i1.p1 TRINITY_DN11942_c0_g1~~TRINITY_DN11942_c0_g1_i1.p1  ORF type:complete len:108 (-),score=22.25 TRINITY_DN11942_c0_g1_i1:79-402(-)
MKFEQVNQPLQTDQQLNTWFKNARIQPSIAKKKHLLPFNNYIQLAEALLYQNLKQDLIADFATYECDAAEEWASDYLMAVEMEKKINSMKATLLLGEIYGDRSILSM